MTQPAAPPANEADRQACLSALDVLDTAPEPVFEQITQLAAEICGVPIALVSLVDAHRQWFKSNVGLAGVSETHRDLAFCAHAILSNELMEVVDAELDPRFSANPLVTDGPRIRFYAGAPLTMPRGERLGTLCVIDTVPRQLTPMQRTSLAGLARIVTTTLLERKQRLALTNELAQTEASYQVIVEGQSELISLAREDGVLTYVNAAYAHFFGLQPADMLGRNLLDYVADSDRPAVTSQLTQVLAAGQVATGANRMVSADGAERWVAWTNRCIPAGNGGGKSGQRSIHSVGRDITDQRRAEMALAQNEARSRMLYEATPAMLHSIDLQGRLLNVSDAWLKGLGYAREEVVGHLSSAFLTPESARRASDEVLPAFFLNGRCDDIPYQMLRKDGTAIDVLLSAVLERDAHGKPIRSLAVVQDVTERNLATASLAETTHMLQLVLDSVPARISYWDSNNLNRFANKAFVQWFGLEQTAIAGRHARDVLGAGVYARIEQPISRGLAGQTLQIELASPGPDGTRQTTDMRFIPDHRDGQLRGLFVFALDITAQRQTERDLADQQRRFKLLVDGVRDYAIYMLDPQGHVVTWNAGAERNKGYAAAEILGKPYSMFFTREEAEHGKPEQALAMAARDGRFEGEGWRVRGDGSRFWAGVLLSAIRDESGELIGFAKITRDLTEQKRQQALLIRAVELAPCAMLMVDPKGMIVMVNAQAESMFDFARGDMLGQPVEMLIPSRIHALHKGLRGGFTANASARGMGTGRDLRALRRSGEEFPVEIGLSPIDTAQGTATLAAVFDISERRRQQAATEQALAEKETLLKEVYHRVKNNLQVVQSLLNLQRHALPEGLARDAMHDSVQRVRAMALVHEKLYQSGNLAAISLPKYTRELMDQIADAHGADRSNISLHADIADIETGLDAAVPYGLLLTELVTNSLKHAFPSGRGGVVRVALVREYQGDLLTVADDGAGYAGELGPSSHPSSMGLKLADSLARQLGGELRTRSDTGTVSSALLTRLRVR